MTLICQSIQRVCQSGLKELVLPMHYKISYMTTTIKEDYDATCKQ